MICPFCSLLCDFDETPSCELHEVGLQRQSQMRDHHLRSGKNRNEVVPTTSAYVRGTRTSLDDAIHRAAELLCGPPPSRLSGYFACVDSMNAALNLARQCDAFIDTTDSAAPLDYYRAIQHQGLVGTSLSEARARSDLFLLIGDDRLFEANPLLLDRLLTGPKRVTDQPRRILLLGNFSPKIIEEIRKRDVTWSAILSDIEQLPESLFGLLDERWQRELDPNDGPVRWMAQAEFIVVVWNPALIEVQHRQDWHEYLLQWIQRRNRGATCAALPIHSLNGIFTTVSLWATGMPRRIRFQNGQASADRSRELDSTTSRGGTDLWIDERWKSVEQPPSARIVLSPKRDGSHFPPSEVLIPIGIPGVHYDAVMIHADGTQLLRCRAIEEDKSLPTVASVLASIEEQVRRMRCETLEPRSRALGEVSRSLVSPENDS